MAYRRSPSYANVVYGTQWNTIKSFAVHISFLCLQGFYTRFIFSFFLYTPKIHKSTDILNEYITVPIFKSRISETVIKKKEDVNRACYSIFKVSLWYVSIYEYCDSQKEGMTSQAKYGYPLLNFIGLFSWVDAWPNYAGASIENHNISCQLV
jgi:CDP-diglyceride synthetase